MKPFRLGIVHLSQSSSLAFSATALASCLLLTSCGGGSNTTTTTPPTPVHPDFTTTVFLGDSLTAGFQSGSLLDTAEVHGWAPLFATQAGFPITQALIAYPGAPATLLLQAPGPPPVITQASGTTTGRDNASDQVSDLAVPGAVLNDIANTIPVAVPTTDDQIITDLVLGFPGLALGQDLSQTGFAIKANPTTIFLWAGNNDALVADSTGMPSSMTSTADFTSQYTALIQLLHSQTSAHLVLGNIPDVTLVPYLTPAATVLGEFAASTGQSAAALGTLFGLATGDLVTPEGLSEISAILNGTQTTPLSDAGVLTAAEVVTVQAQVTAYNNAIAAQATSAGATLVDIHSLFNTYAASGLAVNGFTGTTSFLGGLFSLDGIHPTNTGYAAIANTFIDAVNASLNGTVPDVDLTTVAATDPLWPPNFTPATTLRRPRIIPVSAAATLNRSLFPTRSKR